MQLWWQRDEGMGADAGSAPAARETAPSRTRRWRRIVSRPVVVAPAPTAPPVSTVPCAPTPSEQAPDAAVSRREPGFVAVAIARVLIAIHFALGRPR